MPGDPQEAFSEHRRSRSESLLRAVRDMTPQPPVPDAKQLANAEGMNIAAGFMKAEDKLKTYDPLFTAEFREITEKGGDVEALACAASAAAGCAGVFRRCRRAIAGTRGKRACDDGAPGAGGAVSHDLYGTGLFLAQGRARYQSDQHTGRRLDECGHRRLGRIFDLVERFDHPRGGAWTKADHDRDAQQ